MTSIDRDTALFRLKAIYSTAKLQQSGDVHAITCELMGAIPAVPRALKARQEFENGQPSGAHNTHRLPGLRAPPSPPANQNHVEHQRC
jgi:hypothetical protein